MKFSKLIAIVSLPVLACTLVGTTLLHATAEAATTNGNCQTVTLPVGYGPGQPNNLTLHGTFCTPRTVSDSKAVDILIPGGSYDSLYWDFPYQPQTYSYVEKTLAAGRATFNIDRLGTGQSSKPLSATVTEEADAYTVHQAIQWLRSTKGYSTVTMIGHSAGSIVAAHEAAQYNDASKLVFTGFLHSPSINLILTLGGGLYPAALDSQFIGKIIDPGYLTTIPGKRASAFYASSADPKVIAYDDAHKNIVSGTEAVPIVSEILTPAALNISQRITAPVLTIVGDQDILCGPVLIGVDCSSSTSVQNYETPYYPHAASYQAIVVPNTGHNLPLHPSANQSFAKIDQWIRSH
jgi:pimeloyl-ACP methyl ester carboxylesterase